MAQSAAANPGELFLGIDHTAIVVSKADASLRFYRDLLGLKVVGESENYGVEMQFHPVTSDYTLTRADLMSEEDLLSGILDKFYSCPECGRTAIPNEMYAGHAVVAYR